jgi:acyl-coenzyme A synthetase/AMP-(fatty) acid ligase
MNDIDVWWHKVIERAESFCEPGCLDSTHPLYILYTSGTTGKPKGSSTLSRWLPYIFIRNSEMGI